MVQTKKRKRKVCSLENALDYNGEVIIHKFMEAYDVSFEEGQELFEETLKWLWFCNQGNKAFIDKSMIMIDNMWHTFILFTKPYAEYCLEKYGYFLHHAPATKEEKEKARAEMKENKKEALKRAYERSKKQYEAIHDILGPETLIKWYKTFPEKYSVKQINELTKKL